jgi:hypothetical protein
VSLNKLFSEWTENEDAQEGEEKMQERECIKKIKNKNKTDQRQGIWRRKKYGKSGCKLSSYQQGPGNKTKLKNFLWKEASPVPPTSISQNSICVQEQITLCVKYETPDII